MAETTTTVEKDQTKESAGPVGGDTEGILKYPLNILNEEVTELMRFSIKARDNLEEDKQTIYLYTPAGVASADSATYNTQDFGFTGALQQNMTSVAPAIKGDAGATSSLKDTILANKSEVAGGLAVAAKDQLGWGVLQKGMITAGRAKNAHTNLAFDGVGMRSFTFTFKLVGESEKESEEIRKIENTFRKFLYPSNEKELGIVLKYPPYWSIQFMSHRDGKVDENPYLPYIDLCYLRSVSTTYNSSTNAYHKKGQPIELDLALAFDEAQQNTREGLYKDPLNFKSTTYHYERGGLESTAPEAFKGEIPAE